MYSNYFSIDVAWSTSTLHPEFTRARKTKYRRKRSREIGPFLCGIFVLVILSARHILASVLRVCVPSVEPFFSSFLLSALSVLSTHRLELIGATVARGKDQRVYNLFHLQFCQPSLVRLCENGKKLLSKALRTTGSRFLLLFWLKSESRFTLSPAHRDLQHPWKEKGPLRFIVVYCYFPREWASLSLEGQALSGVGEQDLHGLILRS